MVNNIDALVVQITSDKDPDKAKSLLNERADKAKEFYEEFRPSKVIASGGICYTTPNRDEVKPQSLQLAEIMNDKGIKNIETQTMSGDTWTNVVFTYFDHIRPMGLEKPDIGVVGFHRYESLANLILGDNASVKLLNNEEMSFLRDDLLGLVLDTSFKFYGAKDGDPFSHLRAICNYHPEVGHKPMKSAPYYTALKAMKGLNSFS